MRPRCAPAAIPTDRMGRPRAMAADQVPGEASDEARTAIPRRTAIDAQGEPCISDAGAYDTASLRCVSLRGELGPSPRVSVTAAEERPRAFRDDSRPRRIVCRREWPRGIGGEIHEATRIGRTRTRHGLHRGRLLGRNLERQDSQAGRLAPALGRCRSRRAANPQGCAARRRRAERGRWCRRLQGRAAAARPRRQRQVQRAAGRAGHADVRERSCGHRHRRPVQLGRRQGPDPDQQRRRPAPVQPGQHQPGPDQARVRRPGPPQEQPRQDRVRPRRGHGRHPGPGHGGVRLQHARPQEHRWSSTTSPRSARASPIRSRRSSRSSAARSSTASAPVPTPPTSTGSSLPRRPRTPTASTTAAS